MTGRGAKLVLIVVQLDRHYLCTSTHSLSMPYVSGSATKWPRFGPMRQFEIGKGMLPPPRIGTATNMRCACPPFDAAMSSVTRMGDTKQHTKSSKFMGALDEAVRPDATIGDLKRYTSPSENRHGNSHERLLPVLCCRNVYISSTDIMIVNFSVKFTVNLRKKIT